MSKSKFQQFVLKNLKTISSIKCIIWNGQDLKNNEAKWLEVFVESSSGFHTIFCSDEFDTNDSSIEKLQSKWVTKLNNWINPNWDLELIVDSYNI